MLVVEDDRSVRESLVTALRLEGYDVEAVSDGEAALERVERAADDDRPDAMLLDVMMPNLDGLTVCRRLRARGDTTPILMLTARHELADRVSGLDAGADDYLVKPFALDELTRATPGAAAPHERLGRRPRAARSATSRSIRTGRTAQRGDTRARPHEDGVRPARAPDDQRRASC